MPERRRRLVAHRVGIDRALAGSLAPFKIAATGKYADWPRIELVFASIRIILQQQLAFLGAVPKWQREIVWHRHRTLASQWVRGAHCAASRINAVLAAQLRP